MSINPAEENIGKKKEEKKKIHRMGNTNNF